MMNTSNDSTFSIKSAVSSLSAASSISDEGISVSSQNRQKLKQLFSIKKIIQSSSIAQIYAAIDRQTGQEVIVKRSLKSKCLTEEIQFMELAHKIAPEFCLPVIHKSYCKKYVNFAIPKFGMSLYDFMVQRNRVLGLEEARVIFRQVLTCLAALQQHNLYHLDIKEENILVDPASLKIKLIDFGCSSNLPIFSQNLVGSKEFCAPEIYIGESNFKSIKKHDVWSLGVTMISSMTGNTPYDQIENLISGEEDFEIQCGNVDEIFTCELKFLLTCMLELNYERRISLDNLKKSKFFQ